MDRRRNPSESMPAEMEERASASDANLRRLPSGDVLWPVAGPARGVAVAATMASGGLERKGTNPAERGRRRKKQGRFMRVGRIFKIIINIHCIHYGIVVGA